MLGNICVCKPKQDEKVSYYIRTVGISCSISLVAIAPQQDYERSGSSWTRGYLYPKVSEFVGFFF